MRKLQYGIFLLVLMAICNGSWAVGKGDRAKNINLPSIRDASHWVNLSELEGKVVYIDFWASWCGPCRKAMPALNKIRREYKDKGFEVYAVNLDESVDDGLKFLDRYPVDYPVVSDPSGKTAELYRVQGMPTSFIVDKKGKVAYVHSGFTNKDIPKIKKLVKRLLAKK